MNISYCVIKHNSLLPLCTIIIIMYFIGLRIDVFKSPTFHVVEKNVPLVFFANRVNGKEDELKILISQRAGISNLPFKNWALPW